MFLIQVQYCSPVLRHELDRDEASSEWEGGVLWWGLWRCRRLYLGAGFPGFPRGRGPPGISSGVPPLGFPRGRGSSSGNFLSLGFPPPRGSRREAAGGTLPLLPPGVPPLRFPGSCLQTALHPSSCTCPSHPAGTVPLASTVPFLPTQQVLFIPSLPSPSCTLPCRCCWYCW